MAPTEDHARPANDLRRIGLLGGSFNPAHSGHREISLAALDRLDLDVIWWLVTPGNPLKDKTLYAPYEERLQQARAVADHTDIVISDFEKRHGLQYTVDTLVEIQALNPNAEFVWLMGADSLENFHRWKDWEQIAQTVPMAIFNRPGHGNEALTSKAAQTLSEFQIDPKNTTKLWEQPAPAWVFFADMDNPISSTELRKKAAVSIEQNQQDATDTPDLVAPYGALSFFLDLHPDLGDFRADAIKGLSQTPKEISPKYFYDERGSKIFNKITEAEEYYPTRTEKALFLAHATEINNAIRPGAAVFEYGSGSSEKVEGLIDGIDNPAGYVALDISRDHLLESATTLSKELSVPIGAICADFNAPVKIPTTGAATPTHWLGYFPGSTIGNMLPDDAIAFLNNASKTLGADAQFLVGLDLEKDKAVLEAAYDDAQGVTANFNLNLLHRMQRELDAELTIDDFEHYAFYNEDLKRVEMHLRAVRATTIVIGDDRFSFAAGETLHTENSHKFTQEKFTAMVNQTPWRVEKWWTDANQWYAACLLSNN